MTYEFPSIDGARYQRGSNSQRSGLLQDLRRTHIFRNIIKWQREILSYESKDYQISGIARLSRKLTSADTALDVNGRANVFVFLKFHVLNQKSLD